MVQYYIETLAKVYGARVQLGFLSLVSPAVIAICGHLSHAIHVHIIHVIMSCHVILECSVGSLKKYPCIALS